MEKSEGEIMFKICQKLNKYGNRSPRWHTFCIKLEREIWRMTGDLALLQRKGEKKENVSVEVGQCSSGSVKNSNLYLFTASREAKDICPILQNPVGCQVQNTPKQSNTPRSDTRNVARSNKGRRWPARGQQSASTSPMNEPSSRLVWVTDGNYAMATISITAPVHNLAPWLLEGLYFQILQSVLAHTPPMPVTFVCTAPTKIVAHVKDPMPTFRIRQQQAHNGRWYRNTQILH